MNKRLPIFGMISIIIILMLLPRIWAQRLLFTDSSVRRFTQETLEHIAEEEGLLLSGFSINSLTPSKLEIFHRSHMRGEDIKRCFIADISILSYSSCDASS